MTPLSHEEVQGNAGGFAALPPDDAERAAAYAHARTCESCSRALAQGEALQRVLGQIEMPAPTPEALRRSSAVILAELRGGPSRRALAPTGLSVRALAPLAPALLSALGWALLLAFSSHPIRRAFAVESALFALVGASCAAVALTSLRAWALPTAVVASAALVVASAAPGPFLAALGLRCLLAEVACGALPLALTAALALRGRTAGGALLYAGVAAGGALAGQAALQLTCPASAAAGHLAGFHLAGVLVAALVGAAVSRAPPLRHAPA